MSDDTKKPMEDGDLGAKEQEFYETRLEKMRKWKELGANPFGNGFSAIFSAIGDIRSMIRPQTSPRGWGSVPGRGATTRFKGIWLGKRGPRAESCPGDPAPNGDLPW
ncbi:MAG: hypothetical protein ACT4TC_26060, partial [Myxococcaceae bacterium]